MQIPFAASTYSRTQGLPPASLVNLYVEATPNGEIPDARLPRPGLVSAYSLGSGPIRGLIRKAGFQAGAMYTLSGTTLYKTDGSTIGSITGTSIVRYDASPSQMVIVAPDTGLAYLWDGTTFGQITDPDLGAVIDVVFIAGRFVFLRQNSGRFVWSNINDAGNEDGLSFATAESSPDNGTALAILGDQMAVFGEESVEYWSATSDGDNPYQVNEGTRYQKGCLSQTSIVLLDNALFFVGNDKVVYRTGNVAQRISDHGIEDKLRQCTAPASITAFAALVEGHAWYVMNLPGVGSYAYDVPGQRWAEWSSYGRTTFRANMGINVGGTCYVGDDTAGTVGTLVVGALTDYGQVITRLASAYYAVKTANERCNNVILQSERGVGLTTGQGSDPIVEMRYSDNAGKTWSDWRQGTLGKIGEYGRRAYWKKQGMMKRPGRLFLVRSTDPVNTVLESLYINEDRI